MIFHKKVVNSIAFIDPHPSGNSVIIMLHGLGADATSWMPQFNDLITAGLRPIALDIPGFGLSAHEKGRWTIGRASSQLDNWLDDMGITTCHLMGLSMGGAFALSLVLLNPKRVRSIILVNTFARLIPINISQSVYFFKRSAITLLKGSADQAEIVAWRVFPKYEQAKLRSILIRNILDTDPHIYREAMVSLGLFNVRRKLNRIGCPALVVSGKDDTTVSLTIQKELVDGIRGSIHEVIASAGHAVSVDQPKKFNEAIIRFIDGNM